MTTQDAVVKAAYDACLEVAAGKKPGVLCWAPFITELESFEAGVRDEERERWLSRFVGADWREWLARARR